MNATKQTPAVSSTGYKQLLLTARTLRGKSGVKAYDRAKILCRVFDDGEFRQSCGNIDDFRAAELLDEYIDDLCIGFLDLRAMLDEYPRRKQWADGRLRRMLQAMLNKKETNAAATKIPRVATAETRKQLERQLDDARKEKARLVYSRQGEIEVLQQRICELEAENAALRARVSELEKLASA